MKKFLLKTLIAVTLFSFTGVGGFSGFEHKTIIVQAQQSIVNALGNPTVYYTPSGKSFHLSRNCSALSRSKTVYSGQLKDVISSKSDPCNICVKYTSSTTSSSSSSNVSNSNTSTQKNNVVQLNVNKEELKKYLENAYKKAFEREIDDEGLNYWMNQYNKNLKNNNSKNAIVLTVKEMMKSDELKQIAQKIGILY
ncbi:DUF4214 domain-containing protein [Candidatus Arthromitus sp. SFB-turkey]|uniref:DUF4214 domain-containing protein n=1 Tax=Candidatus Arthromitus sp. SFB-turkey TaxID=1840217 RepID=UPI0007F4FF35|nr:DUF4214 domain-containing protein [Candidatus Arthromitus sp. SFB-turkey]OAT87882.1 hypothetical protein A6P36_03405 [Candidatus Arthromitus sp. SFB-turkey]